MSDAFTRAISKCRRVTPSAPLARSRARTAVFATGGRSSALRQETLDLLAAPAVPPTHGFYDECLKGEVQFSLGFMKPGGAWRFGGLAPSDRPVRVVRLRSPTPRPASGTPT